MKHKYAEQIHAFAEGAKIQRRKRTKCSTPPPWEDTSTPIWLDDFEYRVKPDIDTEAVMAQNRELLEKIGRLRIANDDLYRQTEEQEHEIGRLNMLIKCLDNSNTVLTTESRVYRQVEKDLQARIDALLDENADLIEQNTHLKWAHDTAQACRARTQEQLDALNEAEVSADADAQAFGADIVISIQFPPMEKL